MCKKLLFGQSKENTIIAYGNGNFNTSFGHHKASPKATLISKKCKELGMKVEMINEFNTSKICSKCILTKLTDLASENIKSHHFVRFCSKCQTVWQRDINSARHMGYIYMHLDRPKGLHCASLSISLKGRPERGGENPSYS